MLPTELAIPIGRGKIISCKGHLLYKMFIVLLCQMCAWGEWYSEQMGLECQRLIPEAEARLEDA
jgi:hypothetical protein